MEDEKAGRKKENGKEVTKKGVVIGATALALVLILVVIAVVLLMNKGNTDGDDGSMPPSGVANVGHGRIAEDGDEEEDFMSKASEALETTPLPIDSYAVQMHDSTWRFKDSSSPSYDAEIYNAEENGCDVYFTLQVKETEELIFVSDTMSPGQKMTDIELDFDADAGSYPCSMVYHMLDSETGTEFGTLTLAITVVIEN